MKKVFITLGVLILVVITALMVIPTFFKGDILQIIEKQSAKYINAKLKIGDMNLSMFISFPNLNVALKEVMITGQDEFAGHPRHQFPQEQYSFHDHPNLWCLVEIQWKELRCWLLLRHHRLL